MKISKKAKTIQEDCEITVRDGFFSIFVLTNNEIHTKISYWIMNNFYVSKILPKWNILSTQVKRWYWGSYMLPHCINNMKFNFHSMVITSILGNYILFTNTNEIFIVHFIRNKYSSKGFYLLSSTRTFSKLIIPEGGNILEQLCVYHPEFPV